MADLDHERIQMQADIAHERGEIQSDAAQWQSRMRHLDRQLEAYTNLDFLNYVKRVVKVV
ncbi:MAG: hypothetical protein IPK16_28910 [Anaerolineales bacterium]|nr:hypothetical protein [Anaerolineales bacterium]